jgi:branched-chain amino acid transport system permease protein
MGERGRWNRVLTAVLIALALVAPFIFYPVFIMEALCFALFACAFNLLIGYVGLLSFGHAAFFGAAAYITAHTVKVWDFPPELGLLAGTGVAALFGVVFGWLAIRRQGLYFAMITLALAQMVYFVALQARFTGGEAAAGGDLRRQDGEDRTGRTSAMPRCRGRKRAARC